MNIVCIPGLALEHGTPWFEVNHTAPPMVQVICCSPVALKGTWSSFALMATLEYRINNVQYNEQHMDI